VLLGAAIQGADFRGANITGAVFDPRALGGPELRELVAAALSRAVRSRDARGAGTPRHLARKPRQIGQTRRVERCRSRGKQMERAQLALAVLANGKFAGTNLTQAAMAMIDLGAADLRGAVLETRRSAWRAVASRASQRRRSVGWPISARCGRSARASATSAPMASAPSSRTPISMAPICARRSCIGADFSGANLLNADLRDADLQSAVFTGATLEGANFEGANRPARCSPASISTAPISMAPAACPDATAAA